MSIEAPKTVEETPAVPPKTTEPTAVPALPTETPAVAETPAADSATPATEELKKGETVVEAVPASEGVLGYKEPGFLKQFRYSKNFFWFGDEASSAESLTHYLRGEKSHHEHAAWARETGQGVLFHAKRAEDKATPAGLIMLHDVSTVIKEGLDSFTFKVGTHTHRFEAATPAERDSWVVAIEKKVEEAKALKDEITGRDSYKKNVEEYAKPAAVAAAAVPVVKSERAKSKEPKKSLDATTATAAAPTTDTASSVSEEEKKKSAKKERSQSRKRASIFGALLGKKDERDEQKEVKKEEAEADKEAIKEDKKVEAELKKEEAKETHDLSKATEAAGAAAVAAVPAAVIAEKKHEDKEEKTDALTEKKAKRASVFGGLFGKKGVTSPTGEKTEGETGLAVPLKDSDVPPVSENAPKIDEPIENKPIDTAAVTAPVDNIAAETAVEEPTKELTAIPPTETTTPKTEKKGGFLGLIKKQTDGKKEHKKEVKEEHAAEVIAKDPVAAAAPIETPAETTETPAVKEERPAREKRRTSFFGGLGNKKKASETETSEETIATEKREKSPLPTKLGGLFRKPSKAVKSEGNKETTPATTEAAVSEEATPAVAEPESKIVGDVVPEDLHVAPIHDTVTIAPEVKASA